jgi:hypothetical protein
MASFFFGRSFDHRSESHSTLGFGHSADQLRILLRAGPGRRSLPHPLVRSSAQDAMPGVALRIARGRAFAKRGGIVY